MKSSLLGKNRKKTLWIILGILLALGLGIRLYDLTDPPLDFHSTRQLWSAITARGMYYQYLDDAPDWKRDLAVEAWKSKPVIEPVILESMTALAYRIAGQELLWIPRIFSSIFWSIGGIFLFLLAQDISSTEGAILALAFYLFLPFGVVASRSFQPDPFMVMWIIMAWWAFYRWHTVRTWKTAIIAGAYVGIAILVKSVAIFMIFGGAAGLVLASLGIKKAIKDGQVWLVILLSGLPGVAYLLYGTFALGLTSQFEGRFFPELLLDPGHYVRWGNQMIAIIGFSGLFSSLLGIFLFRKWTQRSFVFGLWFGYFIYGLLFPYHFLTHDYYHLPLIPLAALCLAPVFSAIFASIQTLDLSWFSRLGMISVILIAVLLQVWKVRVQFASEDYRHEPPYWEALAEDIGRDKEIIALTQDYGYRLFYYGWINAKNWPETAHLAYRELRGGKPFVFEEWFSEETKGMDYFLVTRLKELDKQGELRDHLYDTFAIAAEGDGYILFDLNSQSP